MKLLRTNLRKFRKYNGTKKSSSFLAKIKRASSVPATAYFIIWQNLIFFISWSSFFAKWQISFLFCGAVGNKYLKWGDGHWWCIYRFSETPFCRECAATKMLHLPVLQKIYTAGGWTYCKVNKIKKYKRGAKLCAWEAKITFLSRQAHAL